MHANVQSHSLPRFRVQLKHCRRAIHAAWLGVGVHDPILRNLVVDDEHGRFVGGILHHIFLLGDTNKVARTLAVRDLLFNMLGGQHALEMTNGVIAKGVNVVAENQGVGLTLDPARFVNDD